MGATGATWASFERLYPKITQLNGKIGKETWVNLYIIWSQNCKEQKNCELHTTWTRTQETMMQKAMAQKKVAIIGAGIMSSISSNTQFTCPLLDFYECDRDQCEAHLLPCWQLSWIRSLSESIFAYSIVPSSPFTSIDGAWRDWVLPLLVCCASHFILTSCLCADWQGRVGWWPPRRSSGQASRSPCSNRPTPVSAPTPI